LRAQENPLKKAVQETNWQNRDEVRRCRDRQQTEKPPPKPPPTPPPGSIIEIYHHRECDTGENRKLFFSEVREQKNKFFLPPMIHSSNFTYVAILKHALKIPGAT